MLETVVTGFIDEFPKYFKDKKMWLTLALCVVAFLLGLLIVTEVCGILYQFNLFAKLPRPRDSKMIL